MSEAIAVAPAEPRWRGYLLSLLGGAFVMLLGFLGLLAALERTGHLPPPPLTNSLCADEKLAFLRDHQADLAAARLLVVGSSVAWRHFDGSGLVEQAPALTPLNAGFCGLSMHQSGFAARWLIGRLGSVEEVVAIVAPQDFADCTSEPAALFDAADAEAFVERRAWRFGQYLRYFDPFSLARNASRIAAQRSGRDGRDPLVMDRWGDAPLEIGAGGELSYGAIRSLDPACFAALGSLAHRLAERHVRLVVATTPIHPDWRRRFDPDGALLDAFEDGLRRAAAPGTVWAGHRAMPFDAAAFTDAIHLRWSAARAYSRSLVRQAVLGAGDLVTVSSPGAEAGERAP